MNLAENIARLTAMQNEKILDCLAHPEKYKPKIGPSMDAYGNPGFVGSDGIFRRSPSNNFNGWTI